MYGAGRAAKKVREEEYALCQEHCTTATCQEHYNVVPRALCQEEHCARADEAPAGADRAGDKISLVPRSNSYPSCLTSSTGFSSRVKLQSVKTCAKNKVLPHHI